MHGANPESSHAVGFGIITAILRSAFLNNPFAMECSALGLEERATTATGDDKSTVRANSKAAWLYINSKTAVRAGPRAQEFDSTPLDIDPIEPAGTPIPARTFSQETIAA
jgi:hypothetical protein